MPAGVLAPTGVAKERAELYQGRVTLYVIITCIVADVGGSIFGYDIEISGGVTSMDGFLQEFFHSVYISKQHAHENNYCRSSCILGGISCDYEARPPRKYNLRGLNFLVGASVNAGTQNLAMLLFGRIMLGVGIGFGNQAVPLYLSEMAPTRLRGALNMMFQVATTFGIFTANMVNYGTQKLEPWGWRLSLGLAAIPALHPKLYSNKITTRTRTTAATTTIKTKRRSRTDSISIYQRNKRSPEDHDSSRRGFGVGSRSFMAALRFMSIVVIASVVVVL